MKKNVFLSLLILLSIAFSTKAQTLVSTQVQNKNVLLEEFTGIHCGYCPSGHQIAQSIYDNNPGRVVLINIHQGGYANPDPGEPDYRTPFGNALAGQAGVSSYPSGTVNRHLFPGNSSTGMGRGAWAGASNTILNEVSPVNVGASSEYDAATKELTVNVELYYTANSPATNNFINVALIQNGIIGPQSGGSSSYEHKHMLRHLITGQWGDEITTTTEGTLVQKTYTYTVPDDYNSIPCIIEDCEIAVFVTESHQEVYSACVIPAIDGTTLVASVITTPQETFLSGQANNTSTFDLSIKNQLPADDDFELSLQSINQPSDWSSSFTIAGNTYDQTATVNLVSGVVTNFTIDITPGASSGVAQYVFTAKSISNPNLSEVQVAVYVMTNVQTLLIHNQGVFGSTSSTPSDFEPMFFNAFDAAGITKYAACDYKTFRLIGKKDLLQTIDNVYFNVSWTFPSLTNENVAFFSTYLDNGGNLFISGQDVGWDTWSATGNGTSETKAFYTNYLCADWKDDGDSQNNSVYAKSEDDFFGNIANFTLTDVYGNNMYPDVIDAVGTGVPIFFYNNEETKNCGVRSNNNTYKTVYLGFDFAMATSEGQNNIIQATKDFFNSNVSIDENHMYTNIDIYPNPCFKEFYITSEDSPISDIKIYNALGKLVFEKNCNKVSNIKINTSNFEAGVYFIKINDRIRKLVVK